MVVTKTLDAIAGSTLNFFNDTGTIIPNTPATSMFSIIDTAIRIDQFISLNHNCTKITVIRAKSITLKIKDPSSTFAPEK